MPRRSLWRRCRIASALAATLTWTGSSAEAQSPTVGAAETHAAAAAEESITLQTADAITRSVPGATAAFALDPSRVAVSMRPGFVTMTGRAPGSTHVVVVIGERTLSFAVAVNAPRDVVLANLAPSATQEAERGFYEVRYASDPQLLQTHVDFSRQEGQRTAEVSAGTATVLSTTDRRRLSVPLATVSLRSAGREVTLFDRVVTTSPLTVSRSNVRGVHVLDGPWRAHAGYSFFANFEHLLLPFDGERLAGLGYRKSIDARRSVTPNLYYFNGAQHGATGAIGTLLYEGEEAPGVNVLGEIGAGRRPAAAAEVTAERGRSRSWAKLRLVPRGVPSLSTNEPAGRLFDAGWNMEQPRVHLSAGTSSQRYGQGTFDNSTSVAHGDVRYKPSTLWSIHGGSNYSVFDSHAAGVAPLATINIPAGVDIGRNGIAGGLEYQFSSERNRALVGHLVRGTTSLSLPRIQLSSFVERQSQAPTAEYILTQAPWLQQALDRLGLTATTSEQLAELMRTNALLASYGYATQAVVHLTPLRTRFGGTAAWSGVGDRAPQLFFSSLVSRDQLVDRDLQSAVHTLTYAQRVGGSARVFFTASSVCANRPGGGPRCRPVASVLLRHDLQTGARILPERRGAIRGRVYRDDEKAGAYRKGMAPIAGVEVSLDSTRKTLTDADGRFEFGNIPGGRHLVEVHYSGGGNFFFTSASRADVETGATVDFGIGLRRSSLRGVLRTDAGVGVGGVAVRATCGDATFDARTDQDGRFTIEGLNAGTYQVGIDTTTLPDGFPLDTTEGSSVDVSANLPGHVELTVRPFRTVAGQVRQFDRQSGRYTLFPGAVVEIPELGRRTIADEQGRYAFMDLPAGDYTVRAQASDAAAQAHVRIAAGPTFLRGIDLATSPAGAITTDSER